MPAAGGAPGAAAGRADAAPARHRPLPAVPAAAAAAAQQNQPEAELPERRLPAPPAIPEQRVLWLLRVLLLHRGCAEDGRRLQRRQVHQSCTGEKMGSSS